jgi:hypothetical protein
VTFKEVKHFFNLARIAKDIEKIMCGSEESVRHDIMLAGCKNFSINSSIVQLGNSDYLEDILGDDIDCTLVELAGRFYDAYSADNVQQNRNEHVEKGFRTLYCQYVIIPEVFIKCIIEKNDGVAKQKAEEHFVTTRTTNATPAPDWDWETNSPERNEERSPIREKVREWILSEDDELPDLD